MEKFMKQALQEARAAAEKGEVPVGAVIVRDGEVISRAHNLTETLNDPTAHAEMLAIRKAAARSGWSRLTGCDMYVTLEPCAMCAGALVWARLDKVYIGTMDPKAGACGSVMNIPQDERLNHKVGIESDIMREECATVLKDFFARRRADKNTLRKDKVNIY